MSQIPPSPEFMALQEAVAGRYSLERELGRGGMGVVFLARDVALDRLVAVKLLPPDLAALREVRVRFLREARTAAGLAHPNIVPIHAVEDTRDLVFFVMGYVDGETLGSRVRRAGPLAPQDVMRVAQEVAWALGHAHARGIVHRDVKPDNVLLERDGGRALVADFGIAASVTADTPAAGIRAGTPQYMSPEQITGGSVDARSDLYSLGITIFFVATGRLPFESQSAEGFITKHLSEAPPPLGRLARALPAPFAALVDRCLAKDPAERPDTAEAFALEVDAARGSLVRVPAPLVRFTRQAMAVGSEAGGYVVGVAGMVVALEAYQLLEGDFLGIVRSLESVMVVLFTGISGARLVGLVGEARRLLREGYDHRALVPALVHEEREARAVGAGARAGSGTLWITAGAGAAATALGIAGMASGTELLNIVGTVATLGAPLVTVRRLWEMLGGGRLFGRLLRGRLGRWLFGIGGLGLDRQPALPAAGERTELALGRTVDELYHALPPGERNRLRDLPSLVARLEADALALRKQPATADGARRLATAVAALETLRLDLLRLHAGSVSTDELTRDLDAARQLGEQIDARLEG